MLIFNEENACSTYSFQNEEKIVWFPNNFLRNAARLPQKQSEIGLNLPDFFIGIDVDLVPSPQFVEDLSNFISTKPQKEGSTDQSRSRTEKFREIQDRTGPGPTENIRGSLLRKK